MCFFCLVFLGMWGKCFTDDNQIFSSAPNLTLYLIRWSRSPNMYLSLASHQEGMISTWKKNSVADAPLQKQSTKNNLISYYLRINFIVTDGVYTALTWPGKSLQPVTNIGEVNSTADVFFKLFGCRPWKYQIESRLRLKISFNGLSTVK